MTSHPTLLTDDAPDYLVEATAETERKAAFNGALTWRGTPLKWTASRAGLFDLLRVPAPMLSQATLDAIKAAKAAEGTEQEAALQDHANALFHADTGGVSTGHVRNATIILWLAAHQPKDWSSISHDRGKMLTRIDEWVDENIGADEIHSLAEVTNKLLSDADATRAISRPRNTNPDEEGN